MNKSDEQLIGIIINIWEWMNEWKMSSCDGTAKRRENGELAKAIIMNHINY